MTEFRWGEGLLRNDPRMGKANMLQRLGLVSAQPRALQSGSVVVTVSVTERGRAALRAAGVEVPDL